MRNPARLLSIVVLAVACSNAPPAPTTAPVATVPPGGNAAPTPAGTLTPQTAVPPGSPATGINPGGSTWQATANSFQDRIGERFRYTCPPNGVNWFLYGTDIYTSDSSVCTAAVHVGLITLEAGGEAVIEILPGQASYISSSRNGITSQQYGAWPSSFTFVGAPPAPVATPTLVPPSPATSTPAPTTPAPTAVSSTEYLTSDALLICLPFDRSRFAEYDPTGKAVGVDVEIGEQIAAQLNRRPELMETLFDDLIDAIEDRACDLSIGGQFITQSRLERIDMIPYREGTPHVIVREGNPLGIDALTDLCGRSFAVVGGTVYVDMVRGIGDFAAQGLDARCSDIGGQPIDLREYDSQADAEAALAAGDVDAYAGNDFVTVDQPDVFDLTVALPLVRNGIGHLLGASTIDSDVRAALRSLIDEGTYLEILNRYGVPDVALTDRP